MCSSDLHLSVAAVFGREVGAAEERAAVGEAEAVQGPAAMALDHLHGVHHQLVDLGIAVVGEVALGLAEIVLDQIGIRIIDADARDVERDGHARRSS